MRTKLVQFLRDGSGSLTVEFVVMTPLLLSALVFSFEFGKALWAYDTIARDLRGAVRYLSRTSSDCGATVAAYRTQAENLARNGVTSGGTAHWPMAAATFSYPSNTALGGAYNLPSSTVIKMTASVPITLTFASALNRMTRGSGTNYTLTVSYQSRCIGN